MNLVVVESPYSNGRTSIQEEIRRNILYVRMAMMDCFGRGEAPFASHALYTLPGVLRDGDPESRRLGIEAGLSWCDVAHYVAVYEDYGITEGMQRSIHRHLAEGRLVQFRRLFPKGEAPSTLPEQNDAAFL